MFVCNVTLGFGRRLLFDFGFVSAGKQREHNLHHNSSIVIVARLTDQLVLLFGLQRRNELVP